MPEMTVIWWRDIPAQVIAKAGQSRASALLAPRFQEAIDAAAMRAGLARSDAYLEQWRHETRECGVGVDAEVAHEVERLDTAYSDDVLEHLVQANGRESSRMRLSTPAPRNRS